MLAVPHFRQKTAWSCGPACVRMILKFYGEASSEAELIEELGANERDGTEPEALARYFRARRNKTARVGNLESAQKHLNAGRPIIVAYQAWAPPKTDYTASWDHGHYSLAIAANDERITLVDPSSKRPRRHIPTQDFLDRWRDISNDGRVYLRWGLSVGPKK